MLNRVVRHPRKGLLLLAGVAGLVSTVALALHASRWQGELQDTDVRPMVLACGNANDPLGTGMPTWPDGKQHYFTRQSWTETGDLKAEVWEFRNPGFVLVSADRHIKGTRIVIKPRWKVPPGDPVAGCYAKFGVEVTFHHLPRGDYVIEAR